MRESQPLQCRIDHFQNIYTKNHCYDKLLIRFCRYIYDIDLQVWLECTERSSDEHGMVYPGLHLGSQVGSTTLRLVCVGGKGDWPYLRKDTWHMRMYMCMYPDPKYPHRIRLWGCTTNYVYDGWVGGILWHIHQQNHVSFSRSCVQAKAFHLNCGFNCKEKCHLCDATNWEDMSMQASWRGTIGPNRTKTPFWDEPAGIHLLQVPGMGQELILPDSCHVFHLGWGLDLAASGICLLARLQCFPGRKFDARLENAYISFTQWISDNKKTTGISWWSTRKLDMKEPLCFC